MCLEFARWFLLICAMIFSSLEATWSTPPVTISSDSAYDPRIVIDSSGNASAVWRNSSLEVLSSYKPVGEGWSDPEIITYGDEVYSSPALAVDASGNVTVVWSGWNLYIRGAHKPVNGEWIKGIDFSTDEAEVNYPQIAVDSAENVMVVWTRKEEGLFYVQSTEKTTEGIEYLAPILNVTQSDVNNAPARIAVDSDGNFTVLFSRSGTGGGLYSTSKKFGDESWPENSIQVSSGSPTECQLVVAGSGTLSAIWSESGSIRTSSKATNDTNWPAEPFTFASNTSDQPQIGVNSNGYLVAVWRNTTTGRIQASYKPVGGNWNSVVDLSAEGEACSNPQIAVDSSGNAIAIWQNDSLNSIQSSTKLVGKSWGAVENVSVDETSVANPQIAFDSSKVATSIWVGSTLLKSSYTLPDTCTVTQVDPNTGSSAGGTTVTITGTNFVDVSAVKFGSTAAQSFTTISETSIEAVSPSGTPGDSVHVIVTTSGGTSEETDSDLFTYNLLPCTVTGLSPTNGPFTGGTTVTITGTNFIDVTAVHFGSTSAASFTRLSETSIEAVAPSGTPGDSVHVTVTASSHTSEETENDLYTFIPCAITSISPNQGSSGGGTTVTITGTSFIGVTGVYFGSVPAQSFTTLSSTSIAAIAPAGTPSTSVDITVTASSQTSEVIANDRYSYFPPTLLPPSVFNGTIHKRRNQKHQFSIHTKWDRSASSHVASYNIYSHDQLIASIPVHERRRTHLHFQAKYNKVHQLPNWFIRQLNDQYKIQGVDTFTQTSTFRHLKARKK